MSMEGGEIKQLTYHQSFDDVDSWSWDSETIYFTSNRFNRFSGYSIGLEGGTPKRLFDHYFDNVHNVRRSYPPVSNSTCNHGEDSATQIRNYS